MLIAVEGIDGAGKNTLVTAVRQQLEEHGVSTTSMGFPAYGQTLYADLADDALHGRLGDTAQSAWGMALLFALDRRERREAIVEAISAFDVVILDRYVASNAAYSWARTQSREIVDWIQTTEFEKFDLPLPDVQVYLGTSVQLAAERAEHREANDVSRTRDVYERDASLQDRTSAAYQSFAAENWASPWLVSNGNSDELTQWIVDSLRRD